MKSKTLVDLPALAMHMCMLIAAAVVVDQACASIASATSGRNPKGTTTSTTRTTTLSEVRNPLHGDREAHGVADSIRPTSTSSTSSAGVNVGVGVGGTTLSPSTADSRLLQWAPKPAEYTMRDLRPHQVADYVKRELDRSSMNTIRSMCSAMQPPGRYFICLSPSREVLYASTI